MIGKELLQGKKVSLRALDKADAAAMAPWFGDSEFMRLHDAAVAKPKTIAQISEMIEEEAKSEAKALFAIQRDSDGVLIGRGGIDEILWSHRVGWMVIGLGPAYWGQGYGGEAMGLLLRYAFYELNLYKVQLTVFSYNHRAMALYQKLGFQQEGVFREYLCRDGQRHDMILMGLLAREWQAG